MYQRMACIIFQEERKMSYVSEAQQLQADTEMKLTALYNKYSDYVPKGLDDDPGSAN